MNFKKFLSIFSLSAFLLASPISMAFSSPAASPPQIEQKATSSPVNVNLISEEQTIQPGKKFWVGVELKMAEGWDTYWINPGDAGLPTNVTWDLPENFKVSSLFWPYPERFTSESFVGFGYTHSVLLLAEVTPPANLALDKEVKIGANVQWLACNEQCVPGNAHINLNIPVSTEAPKMNNTAASQFLKAREHLPKSLSQNEGALSIAPQKEEFVLNFKPALGNFSEIVEALFVPESGEMIDYQAPQLLHKGDMGYFLNVKRANPQNDLPSHIKGVLIISEKGSEIKKAIQVDMPLSATAVASHPSHSHVALSFELALLFAFLGGLILNVMPCVLPVISLKLFSFIKMAHQKRGEIFKQGCLFGAGVISSFWVLSGLLLILRASGEGIGWGFQLQEPIFVALLTLVLFLLGLSLFGVFELGTSLISVGEKVSSKGSFFKGSFMSGVLATLVATPCTGPLMGPALGLAMTLPPISSLTIFTMIGLGMASPYLFLSAFPSLIRFLPKPGNWMITFKQLMGFLMMATCAWLVWVFVGQTDHITLLALLLSLLLVSIAAWIYGKWATFTAKRGKRLFVTAVSLMMVVFGGGMTVSAINTHRHNSPLIEQIAKGESWDSFSTEKLDALRKEGKAVFVDFTAKWCLICQANKVTLHSEEVEKAFGENNVVPLIADWTKKDPSISNVLHGLGRSGVPLYVIYPADPTQAPIILPQTLTKSVVQDYLKKLDTPATTVYAP